MRGARVVDIATAEHHGICPECEGYGGNGRSDCPNELCWGSCSCCWCEGCHDGHGYTGPTQGGEDACGSWEAYAAVQAAAADASTGDERA
jgi:hypothetical protein